MSYSTAIKVIDGDSFESSQHQREIRLSNVYAPEKREPGYQDCKKHLKELIVGKKVEINRDAIDDYNRIIAKVYTQDGKSVNENMRQFIKKIK